MCLFIEIPLWFELKISGPEFNAPTLSELRGLEDSPGPRHFWGQKVTTGKPPESRNPAR
jgi:hypothetical protein